MLNIEIIEGGEYGYLKFKSIQNRGTYNSVYCECICGKELSLGLMLLKRGEVKSCGCMKYKNPVRTHGLHKHPLYKKWLAMNARIKCKSTNGYKNYGGRGISCEWESINEFISDMYPTYHEGLELDRIDVNGNYSKSNCRWITRKENCRNRRNSIIWKGEHLKYWCEIYGKKYQTVYDRIKYKGMSIEESLKK